jgi:hypothetical protein
MNDNYNKILQDKYEAEKECLRLAEENRILRDKLESKQSRNIFGKIFRK